MMKRLIAIAFLFLVTTTLISCDTEESTPTASPTIKTTSTPMETPTPIPTVQPSPTPLPNLSYTTGLPYDGEYQPVMVVIENSPAARPQTGLQTADIVYEMPVEGSITRFVCVFSDNVPEEVMPVRSGRVSFLYIQQEWDTLFMHFGGSGNGITSMPDYTYYGNELFGKVKIDIDGNYDSEAKPYFIRVDGVSWTHNVMMYPKLAQQLYDYNPKPLSWLFDSEATYIGESVTEINLKMCSSVENFVSYTYDAGNDVYLRFMSGKEFKSAETGEQVKVKNIIVQYSTYSLKAGEYKVWKMVGSGAADIYVGGKLIKGSWEKESPDAETIYFDNKGQQIVLRPGNTWIHIHP